MLRAVRPQPAHDIDDLLQRSVFDPEKLGGPDVVDGIVDACRDERYTSLSHFEKDADGNLVGTLELPLAMGLVGGATKTHPTAIEEEIGVLVERLVAGGHVRLDRAQQLLAELRSGSGQRPK